MDEIDRIKDWASNKPWFDMEFVESVEEAYEKYGSLTDSQQAALENIIEKFRIP